MAESLAPGTDARCSGLSPCPPRKSGAFLSCRSCSAELHLSRALATLGVDYEPIVNARDGLLFGQRALARSEDPALARPEALLDVAERLERRAEVARTLRLAAAGAITRSTDPFLFLPIDARDLGSPDLIAENGPLFATRTVLEIGHRSSLASAGDTRQCAMRLRARGYRFAVAELDPDLSGLGAYTLIEPSFVMLKPRHFRGVEKSAVRRRAVASFIQLAKDLGLLVVASGVTSPREFELLAALHCDLLHGRYLTASLPELGALAG